MINYPVVFNPIMTSYVFIIPVIDYEQSLTFAGNAFIYVKH